MVNIFYHFFLANILPLIMYVNLISTIDLFIISFFVTIIYWVLLTNGLKAMVKQSISKKFVLKM